MLYSDYSPSQVLKVWNKDASKCDSLTTTVFDFTLIYLLWRTDTVLQTHLYSSKKTNSTWKKVWMPGRRSLGVIDASLNDLTVPAERKNFREDRQKLKFSALKSLLFEWQLTCLRAVTEKAGKYFLFCYSPFSWEAKWTNGFWCD